MKNFFLLVRNIALFLALFCLLGNGNPMHAQWVKTKSNGSTLPDANPRCFAVHDKNLFVDIYLSTDNGESWTTIDTGLPRTSVNALAVSADGANLFAGTDSGVYLSTNNGTSWVVLGNGLRNATVNALIVSPNGPTGASVFAGTTAGVFLSTNNGTNWSAVNTGLTSTYSRSFSATPNGEYLYYSAVGDVGRVFRSDNNGTSWTGVNTGLSGDDVYKLAVSPNGSNLFAATFGGGVFLSTNNGNNWTSVNTGLKSNNIFSVTTSGTNVFAVGDSGVFLSTNNGAIWSPVNTGLPNARVGLVIANSAQLFVAVNAKGVWRRPLAEMTSVEEVSTQVPMQFNLDQNYPNPFNPTTMIQFGIPSKSVVSLKIYNDLGREVSEVLSGEFPAGKYSREWNATGLPSGIYFYRLKAGSFTETKKLVLLR